ncbi:MAG: protein kinase domain-containing protein [Gemmatimonadaceae bacterium]
MKYPRSRVNSNTIEREIGRGGMATVYFAHDSRHDRPVALKVLDPELGAVLGKERFLAEIRVTARLQHPHLLPLFDSGEAEGQLGGIQVVRRVASRSWGKPVARSPFGSWAAWSPDGNLIAYTSNLPDGSLMVVHPLWVADLVRRRRRR